MSSEPVKIGWYSQQQRDHVRKLKTSGFPDTAVGPAATIWQAADGSNVTVTEVRTDGLAPNWPDAVRVGEVVKFIRQAE